jgi:hypothetical protein
VPLGIVTLLLNVAAPVTPNVPPTVALLVMAALFNVAAPEVANVDKDVAPVTPKVPPTLAFPVVDKLEALMAAAVVVPDIEALPVTAKEVNDPDVPDMLPMELVPATLKLPVTLKFVPMAAS